ncbi:Transposase [Salimicrobium flavidum]|uniref:Transposase n=1 Tax=Salimicrobium flavidum TaxID=570947 RepID=A0A1N7KSK0_9BACI|nr:Transposase [Salimicrobium flavidum]
MNHVIAFDVSMGKSYFVLYNPLKKCEQEGEVMHSKSDFQVLQALIDDITDGYGVQPRIVFEATGAYSKPLERFMRDNDYDYCLLNPLEAKLQCDGLRIHKTDHSDAHQLAMTHFTNERLIKEDTDNRFHQLKQLSRYYNELNEELSVVRNRLHRALQETFPEIEAMFTTKSHLFLNVIQLFPHPDLVLLHSRTIIKNCLLKHTKKRMSVKRAEEKATQLLDMAHNSYPAARSTARLSPLRELPVL